MAPGARGIGLAAAAATTEGDEVVAEADAAECLGRERKGALVGKGLVE